MSLTIFTTPLKDLSLLQTSWSAALNPLLANPITSGHLLNNLVLINGVTVVNHLLGRQMQGWIIVDSNAGCTIYRSAAFNALTLTLTSSAAVTVSLYVF